MYAIRAAHAFDGTRFLPDGVTVLVDGSRIAGVRTGRSDPPAGVEVIDYEGTLLPGLTDCHTHLVADCTVGGLERTATMTDAEIDAVIEQSLRAHAAAGVTTVRDLGDRGYRTLSFRQRDGLPRIVAAGPPITTPGGHCHFLGGEVRDGDLSTAVAERVEHGVDVVKVMASGGFATPDSDQFGAQFTVPELTQLVAAAHRAGLPAVAHAHSLIGMQNAVSAGFDGIEHFSGLTPDSAPVPDDLLDAVAGRGIVVDLTMGNDLARLAMMPSLPPALLAMMERMGIRDFGDVRRRQLGLLVRLRERGAAVVTGVDSGMGPAKQHGNVWIAVADMVEAGYPVADALQAATSRAAEACRLAGETGRLVEGYAADLLVVDGDLTTDITVLGRPTAVIIRGRRNSADASAALGDQQPVTSAG